MKMRILSLTSGLWFFLQGFTPAQNYDICIYGGTASGVIAAVQAGRMHKSVLLISGNRHVGGMVTSGLTATDMNRNQLVGGITREFYQRIYTYYNDSSVWRNQDRESYMQSTRKRTYTGKNDSLAMQWVYESKVGEKILLQMLHEAGVTVMMDERLDLKAGVIRQKGYIHEIRMESGKAIKAAVFIDASYEGDLMAKAGVTYTVGRESNQKYGETLNGIRLNNPIDTGYTAISPYMKEHEPSSGVLPYIDGQPWGPDGAADSRVQAYCYRLTLTNDPANRIPIGKPANYQPVWYEILARTLAANPDLTLQKIISLTPMPNKKTDTNHLDFFGGSYDYPEGDYQTRAKIEALHQDYALGMLWFLGNDPRVPEHIRQEMKAWGLAKDEYSDAGNFPYQIYVREARRMIGRYIMIERNLRGENREPAPQPIGLGTYALDCHLVSRVVDQQGILRNEGTLFEAIEPYGISYQSITPKTEECKNLLVPICLSASHVANSSIRMEPVYMVLGQSAALAAVLAIDQHSIVQNVSYEVLKERLLAGGQIISPL